MNIDIESLDWELLERVAVTEGRRLSKESWNIDDISPAASSALAEIYVGRYLDAPEAIVLPLAEAAAEEFEERYSRDASYPDWPAEFIVGHALAVNARDHACADIGLCSDRFRERALCEGDHWLLDKMGRVTADRLEGVDLDRRVMSEQSICARDVMERAADFELDDGTTALDVLPLTAFEEIAQGLMSSFGSIDLDYSDLEDIDSRIEDALSGLLCDKGHRSKAIGR